MPLLPQVPNSPLPIRLIGSAVDWAIVVLGLLVIYGWKITVAGWNNELTVLGWPMSTQNIALPIASGLTMLFAAWDLVLIFQGKSRIERYGE
jgi:TRAP-type C4-dicarboxylate transport system permease small subunit